MSVVVIDEKNLEFFRNMMNEDALKIFESKTSLALGNVTDGKTDGVIMGELLPGGCFMLEWLYVAKASRGNGIAGTLMEMLKDALSKTSSDCICFNLLRKPGNEKTLDFLAQSGFELETAVQGIATLTLSDLSLLVESISPDGGEYLPFNKVPSYIIKGYFDDKKDTFAAHLYHSEGENAFIEQSCVLLKNEKIEAMLLAQKDEDGISIVLIEGEDADGILKHFLTEAMPMFGRNCLATLSCGGSIGERALKIAGEQEESYEMTVGKLFLTK